MAVFGETQKNGRRSNTAAQRTTFSDLFMTLSSGEIWTSGSNASSGQTRCQQAIYTLLARARYAREEIESLYGSLAGIAAQAHAMRDMDALELASEIMLGLPVSPGTKHLARHYQAVCTNRKGEFEAAREIADRLLEEELDPQLRSRVLQTKAATHLQVGDIDQSLLFFIEAASFARDCDATSLVESLRAVAVIKSFHGDHHQALADLECLLPIGCQISRYDPKAHSALLNSYAVELGETGQVEQALKVVSRVASFASLVPEISDTIPDLQSKLPTRKRSVVVIHRPAEALAAPQSNPRQDRKHATPLGCLIRKTQRRSRSYQALPASSVRFATTITARNPSREPTKPRAP